MVVRERSDQVRRRNQADLIFLSGGITSARLLNLFYHDEVAERGKGIPCIG
jgi:hypothetical protein